MVSHSYKGRINRGDVLPSGRHLRESHSHANVPAALARMLQQSTDEQFCWEHRPSQLHWPRREQPWQKVHAKPGSRAMQLSVCVIMLVNTSSHLQIGHRVVLTQESWGTPRCSGAWPDPPPVMEPMLVGTRRMPSKQSTCCRRRQFHLLCTIQHFVLQHELDSHIAINTMWETDGLGILLADMHLSTLPHGKLRQ